MKTFKMLAALGALVALGDAPARAADGKTFLLTVSVSQYPKLPKFRPLDHADAAAQKLHDALLAQTPKDKREAHFLACSGDPTNYPTVKKIRSTLAHFASQARPDDRVLVVFIGHGFENRDGAALVAYDSELSDPNSFLPVREVVGRLKAMRCNERCVMVDACRDFRDDMSVKEVNDYQDPNDALRKAAGVLPQSGSTFLVQSCSEGEFAYERPDGAGLMTERLIEAFTKPGAADANADGQVTVREAVDYARKFVRDDARGYHRAAQNLADVSSGDPFVLAKVDRLAPGAAPAGSAVATKLPLYPTHEIPLGAPSSPARVAGTGSGRTDRPIVNAAINGIPHNTPTGQVLDQLNRSTWGPGIPNPIPGQVRQYIPQAGAPLVGQIRRWAR